MLTLTTSTKIFLATEPVDMRRGHDGLCALVRYSGQVFVFVGRRRDRVKLLFWDRGGFVLYYNQPSSHYTSFGRRRGPWLPRRDAVSFAARSAIRSQRLQCFTGRTADSS